MLEKAQSPQAQSFNAYDRPHDDLREFIARAERAGEIVRITGADWKLEMGTLAEIVNHARPEPPAILFEEVPGYPAGMRLLSGATNSSKRLAIALGLPVPDNPLDVVRAYRDRMKTHRPIPPKTVAKGPVFENIDRDGKVDVLKFPVPFLHEHDGGRYIGTDDLVIMRDPEANWVNGGTYRAMVQDKTHVSVWISPGKHGRQIRERYFRAGKPCPVLISCGHDPLLFLAGGNELKFGLCEYDYAGGHRGEPYEIVLSELHGLPMPAHAEIVLEGEMVETIKAKEGPFGEFTGYYASSPSEQPLVEVKRVYYRNDPILGIASPMRPPSDFSFSKCVMKAGMIWDEVERAGLSGGCRRVGARIRRRAHVQRHRHQAGLSRPCAPGGAAGGRLPVGLLSRALHRRGRRGRRSDRPVRRDVGDVHALRPCQRHRIRAPHLERTARSYARQGKLDQFARHHRCLSAIRAACGFSHGRTRKPGVAAEGQGKIRRSPRQDRMRLIRTPSAVANGEWANSE